MPKDILKIDDYSKFDSIYNKYYRSCYSYARSYVMDEAEAQDIATESMIKLWQTQKTNREIGHIPSYLFTIVRNAALDVLRERKVKQELLCDYTAWQQRELEINISTIESSSSENIFGEEVDQILKKTLSELPEQTKKVFSMSRFEKMTNKEIAEALNISIKTVEYHITRALKILRVNLKDYLLIYLLFKMNL